MSLYVIADLHLSSDQSKSMEVFGARWTGYVEKLKKNWNAVVAPGDTVVVPGDISWGLHLEDTVEDFRFLDSLNGEKLIGKGNHDFWFSTAAKIQSFWNEHGFASLHILYNNAYATPSCIVCGSRGWFIEEEQQNTKDEVDYAKIINREVIRLRISLMEAAALREQSGNHLPLVAFLHFPPVFGGFVCREILDVLQEYNVKICYFGHIHGAYSAPAEFSFEGIDFRICSADYLHFTPIPVTVS